MVYEAVERIETHIPGLDRVLNGGLLPGGIYLVTGAPGSGKTVLANQFCFALAARGQRSLYLTLLAEPCERLLMNQRTLDYFDESRVPGYVSFHNVYQVLEDEGPKGLLQLLSTTLKRHPDCKLVVIDAVCALEDLLETPRARKRLIRNIGTLVSLMGATLLLLSTGESSRSAERTMADCIMELSERFDGPRSVRELVVAEYRGSPHLSGKHAFEITRAGIIVHPRAEDAATSEDV